MALLDIVNPGESASFNFARGNIGTLVDVVAKQRDSLLLPAGGGAGAIFPLEGDVDLGVTYGPSGSDYTGTLLQPDEADVLSGVQYGADGIEFTGTLTGGGDEAFFNINAA